MFCGVEMKARCSLGTMSEALTPEDEFFSTNPDSEFKKSPLIAYHNSSVKPTQPADGGLKEQARSSKTSRSVKLQTTHDTATLRPFRCKVAQSSPNSSNPPSGGCDSSPLHQTASGASIRLTEHPTSDGASAQDLASASASASALGWSRRWRRRRGRSRRGRWRVCQDDGVRP